MNALRANCGAACKEWAAVCAALAAGRQALLLRKGGIHDPGGQFRPEHEQFWLWPTHFHQAADGLAEGEAGWLAEGARLAPPPGKIALAALAVVEEVRRLTHEELALALAGRHVWAEPVVRQRFAYRLPGLVLLVVRVYRRAEPWLVNDLATYAGCKSWVPLARELPSEGLVPVLGDEAFAAEREAIASALG